MKFLKVPICLILIIMLSGCTKSQFMDLSGFIHNYNEVTNGNTAITDFIYRKDENSEYKLIKGNILITLKEASDGKICECRVMMLKLDEKGQRSNSLLSDGEAFYAEIINVIEAFCHYDGYSAEKLAGEFALGKNADFLKEGELTKKQDNFYFVYYSTPLVCQMMIYDTYLTKIETTKKPKTLLPEEKSHPYETSGKDD